MVLWWMVLLRLLVLVAWPVRKNRGKDASQAAIRFSIHPLCTHYLACCNHVCAVAAGFERLHILPGKIHNGSAVRTKQSRIVVEIPQNSKSMLWVDEREGVRERV